MEFGGFSGSSSQASSPPITNFGIFVSTPDGHGASASAHVPSTHPDPAFEWASAMDQGAGPSSVLSPSFDMYQFLQSSPAAPTMEEQCPAPSGEYASSATPPGESVARVMST